MGQPVPYIAGPAGRPTPATPASQTVDLQVKSRLGIDKLIFPKSSRQRKKRSLLMSLKSFFLYSFTYRVSLTLPDPEPISGTCTSVLRYLLTYAASSSVPERQVGIGVHFLSLRAPESGVKNMYNTMPVKCHKCRTENRFIKE